jgi:hypothetical protein
MEIFTVNLSADRNQLFGSIHAASINIGLCVTAGVYFHVSSRAISVILFGPDVSRRFATPWLFTFS